VGDIAILKIVACYSTFNDAAVLEESLRSLIDLVDFVVVVDGAYPGARDPHDHSWDGTIDIVNKTAWSKCTVIQCIQRMTEPQKRNLYLGFVQANFPDAWLFHLDADEILHDAEEDFEWLRSEEGTHYQVARIFRNDSDRREWYGSDLYTSPFERTRLHPRFYHGIQGLHYVENHWMLRDAAGDRVEQKYDNTRLRKAWLEHKQAARTRQSIHLKNFYNIYERWKYEKTIRPLRSYVPFQLLKAVDKFLNRYDLHPQKYLDRIYGYTMGSRTRRYRAPSDS
jgi:hypothetical protein